MIGLSSVVPQNCLALHPPEAARAADDDSHNKKRETRRSALLSRG